MPDEMSVGLLVELVDDGAQGRRSLGAAFTNWAGSESALRIAFVPDMLVATDHEGRRGYLSEDLARVEVWIERGGDEFMEFLEREFAWSEQGAYRVVDSEPSHADMIDPVVHEGMAIDDVRHMEEH